jgi:peptidoglycan hydrolase CwlO-like protein
VREYYRFYKYLQFYNLAVKVRNLILRGENAVASLKRTKWFLEGVLSKYNSVKNDIASAKNDIVSAKNDIASAKNDIASAKNDIASAKNYIASVKNDIARTKNDIECT